MNGPHDLVELVAIAIYEDMRAEHECDWPNEDDHCKENYRHIARTVIALVRAEPELPLDPFNDPDRGHDRCNTERGRLR